jgi:hypothetical protein
MVHKIQAIIKLISSQRTKAILRYQDVITII